MKTQTKAALLRLGAARRLTRAVHDGLFFEMNSIWEWDMPPE